MNAEVQNQNVIQKTAASTSKASSLQTFRPMRVLVERRWQLLACLLIVCGIAFAATTLRKPWYEATARVEVVMDSPETNSPIAIIKGTSGDYYDTQCQLLRSRRVLARAAEKLNMTGGHWTYSDNGLKELRNSLKIKSVSHSRLIDIIGVADSGAKAAAIANQVTVAFIETSIEARRAANSRIIERMKKQISDCEQEIKANEEVASQFRAEHLISDTNSSLVATENRIRMIEQQLTNSQMKRLELEAKREQLHKMLTTGKGLCEEEMTLPEISSDPTVISLRQKLNLIQQEETQLAQAYLPGHQKLRNVRMQIADIQTKLLDQKRQLMKAAYDETTELYASSVKQEKSLLTLLDQQKQLGVQLTDHNEKYQRILDDLKRLNNFQAQCTTQVREFILKEGMNESPVMVVDAAQVPSLPAGMNKSHQAASILLLGLLFSIGFIFTLDRLSHSTEAPNAVANQTIYVPVPMPAESIPSWASQMESANAQHPTRKSVSPVSQKDDTYAETDIEYLQAKTSTMQTRLGKIDLGGGNFDNLAFIARCRVVHTDQSSPQADSFRAISTQLLSRFWKTRQSLVITSREKQSGKTICACNLALALAKAGRKVLLVDANQEMPALHRVFSTTKYKPDFDQAIHDYDILDQTAKDNEIDTLHILPAAENESLQNDYDVAGLAQFDNQAKQRFDWIIYDGGTLNQKRIKNILQAVGKSILVTSSSEEHEKNAAGEEIEHHGAINLGFIENTFDRESRTTLPDRIKQSSAE